MSDVIGSICPGCGSDLVGDGELSYSYESNEYVESDWSCQECMCIYGVTFKAVKMKVTTFKEEDTVDKEYTVELF